MKKNRPKSVSLIISTYNWPEALDLCLDSATKQTHIPDEVIIADDGSANNTKQVIDRYKSKLNIVHVWHEDNGFRLAEIRNKAIAKSTSEYIIQIDGDIIMDKNFIYDHLKKANKNYFIVGSRVLINKVYSEQILDTQKYKFDFFTKGIVNKFNALRMPLLSYVLSNPTTNINEVVNSARGCNMSFWRVDLLDVNGYNLNMTGWGREDSELAVRMVNNGIIKKRIKLSGIQYHLHHKENDRNGLNKNDEILKETIENKKIKCENGISNVYDTSQEEKINITVIIPTLNEEKRVEKALQSVNFVDEIIIIDSFSTDKTVEIAEKYGARVVKHEFINPSAQKNWIIPQAKHNWILLLDADEWITAELKQEIKNLYKSGFTKDGYWIYRSNFFMGKRVKYSGWQNDKVIRLFDKSCRYNNKKVHEEIETKGKNIGFLKNKMDHNTFTSIDDYLVKLNRYAQWQAEDYHKKVGKVTPLHLIIKPMFRFFIHYIIKLGFLDGVPGLTISVLQSYAVGMRYVKLWLFRRGMK